MTGLLVRALSILLFLGATGYLANKTLATINNPLPWSFVRDTGATGAEGAVPVEVAEFKPKPLEAYRELVSAQILFRARQFVDPDAARAAVQPVPATPVSLEVEVLGIWKERGDERALLALPGAEARWFRAGEQIGTAVLKSIDADGVTIVSDGRERVHPLYSPSR